MNETKDKILLKLVRTNVLTRWPCDVCGGHTEKDSILCEGNWTDEDGDEHLERVCDQCLKAGNLDEKLEEYARHLERAAEMPRKLVGRLVVPTYAEWLEETFIESISHGDEVCVEDEYQRRDCTHVIRVRSDWRSHLNKILQDDSFPLSDPVSEEYREALTNFCNLDDGPFIDRVQASAFYAHLHPSKRKVEFYNMTDEQLQMEEAIPF